MAQTALVSLPTLDCLMPLFALARTESKGLVSAFELMPEEGFARVLALAPQARRPLKSVAEWYVMLRLSCGEEVPDAMSHVLATAHDSGLISDAAVAATAEQEANLWFIHDEVPPPTTFDERGNRHKFDIAIPIDTVVDFLNEATPLMEQTLAGTKTFAFGHVGDGNLHFNIYPGHDCDLASY